MAAAPQTPVSIVFEKNDKEEEFKQPKRLVKIKVKRKEPEKSSNVESRPKMEDGLSMG